MRYTAAVVPVIFEVVAAATLLIGGSNMGLRLADAPCQGGSITIREKAVVGLSAGTSAPSWALFKYPHVYAVDENSDKIHQLTFNSDNTTLTNSNRTVEGGGKGKVHLELSLDGKHMLAASFAGSSIDVYSIAEADGALTLVKTIASTGKIGPVQPNQAIPHPHQVAREGSGRFFFVPDLGTDTILVIDSQQDFKVNSQPTNKPGCGPRHGAFLSLNGPGASSHYALVCELTSTVILYALDISAEGIVGFKELQQLSTLSADRVAPFNLTAARAGEIAISGDNKSLYVSNRLTDGVADSISVFSISGTAADVKLALVGEPVSSGGVVPRMFSLSTDAAQKHIFVGNQNKGVGLRVLDRAVDGTLTFANTIQDVAMADFSSADDAPGPMFVQQITLG